MDPFPQQKDSKNMVSNRAAADKLPPLERTEKARHASKED